MSASVVGPRAAVSDTGLAGVARSLRDPSGDTAIDAPRAAAIDRPAVWRAAVAWRVSMSVLDTERRRR